MNEPRSHEGLPLNTAERGQERMEEQTREKYYESVHQWGRVTLTAAIFLFLGIGCYLSFVKGLHPGWEVIFTAFLAVAAMVGHTWVNLGDLVLYLLLMGPAATYMSQLTGNVKNMRLPSALASCAMLDEKEDRIKRDILATYGVAASVVVNTVFLGILAAAGHFILKVLPKEFLDTLHYIIPALFGAILGQFALKNRKVAAVSMLMVGIVISIPVIPVFLKAIAAIVFSASANLLLHKWERKKGNGQK